MRTLAIVPVKRFALAKQRLRGDVSDEERRALAEAMVTDVLTALASARHVGSTLVVTNEPVVAERATLLGATVLADPHERGQSAAASVGIHHALENGFDRVLLAPGDCPTLSAADLEHLLAHAEPGVVIVPDRHGTGTNALVLTPPDAIAPSFGPGSHDRYHSHATAAGITAQTVEVPSLALDLDTPEDLHAVETTLDDTRGGAAHTRGMLRQLARSRI
jgi:2-phospho-L-lactate/phosphoenolpyruvate guanylyltransferase